MTFDHRHLILSSPCSASPPTSKPNKMGEAAVHAPLGSLVFLLFVSSACCFSVPARYDGFPYADAGDCAGSAVAVEAFFDPVCPDSRDAWPPLQRVLRDYYPRISLIVHPFPLPYHDNAFLACRALHIANNLNASTTYPLMELFFKYQERYYNAPTHNLSRAAIVDDMVKLAVKAVGNSLLTAFQSGFKDPKTDRAARVSFNYGCSRGVTGTPFFFVNGFPLPNPGSAVDYRTWRSIIDPLMEENLEMWEEPVASF